MSIFHNPLIQIRIIGISEFMKYLILFTLLFSQSSFSNQTSTQAVYGEDDRLDIFESANKKQNTIAKSVAAMVPKSMISQYGIIPKFQINTNLTLQNTFNVCSKEKFSSQPLFSECTGFLVGPKLLLTAGHCFFDMVNDKCETHAWIFSLKMENESSINLSKIPKKNVYSCKRILTMSMTDKLDYALVELDRRVVGRKPLKIRAEGSIEDDATLYTIGHPSALPQKIAGNGKLINNDNKFHFETSLDTFQGNSGSPVINEKTNVVEGILIGGKLDYTPSVPGDYSSCQVVNKCTMDGTNCLSTEASSTGIPGERVLRIEQLYKLIKRLK